MRARKESELEELRVKYQEQKVHELERKMAVRYHKVGITVAGAAA